MRMARYAALLVAVMLGACAHQRPMPVSPIAIPATRILATSHGKPTADESKLGAFAQKALAATRESGRHDVSPNCARDELFAPPPHPPNTAHYLVLSGGSLNGAFGAGLFLGFQDKDALPPEPDVVTGVSTGSLQSTFLFLARQTVGGDRDYRWVGGAASQHLPGASNSRPPKPGSSNIEDLALAYSISKEASILKPLPFGAAALLFSGAKGNLDPLRARLLGLISPNTIRAIATEACRGRKLYVGVTNVDDGYGYALDMTGLALLAYDGNASATRMKQVREAYVDGLIASSSVPVGAKPVALRLRVNDVDPGVHRRNLFVDGGARFGVFLREIKDAQAQSAKTGTGDVTLIVNTRLTIEPWHDGDLSDPKDKWDLVTLGLRTVDILENQVYQLSVATVEQQADALRMAYISNEKILENGQPAEEPDDHLYSGKSCKAWHDADEAAAHPIQFFPGYMACLLDYGRRRGQLGQWNN